MVRFLSAAAAAAVLLAGSAPAVANLVANGSFEDGLANWTIGGTDANGFPPVAIFYNSATSYPTGAFGEAVPPDNSMSASPDPVGARAAYFVSDLANNQSLTQSVFLAPGTYEIGFSAYAPQNGFNNAGDATFSGTIAGIQLANYAVSDGVPLVWQAFSGTRVVDTAGIFDVSFVFNTNFRPSKDVVIDRVYISRIGGVNGVPEPASWAMLIAGFGLVGAAARRRRSGLGVTV